MRREKGGEESVSKRTEKAAGQIMVLKISLDALLEKQNTIPKPVYCTCLVVQLYLTLSDPMDCSPPGSSVHEDSPGKNTGVGSSPPRDPTKVSHIAGRFFTV